MIDLRLGDSVDVLKEIDDESIDCVITSPPYDNLKTYDGALEWDFDIFSKIANELYRVLKKGGVIVWVVGDATINGSETGTSFRQVLYFKDIGFNLHDTMIYEKINVLPLNHNRYEQMFEYMFVFSKGKPKTFNPIMIPCKYAGQEFWGKSTVFKTSSKQGKIGRGVVRDTKRHSNIWKYRTGSIVNNGVRHHAPFPKQLASDMVLSWSNVGDVVLDPFMGSGITGIVCIENRRKFIGIEKVKCYFDDTKERLDKLDDSYKFEKVNIFDLGGVGNEKKIQE